MLSFSSPHLQSCQPVVDQKLSLSPGPSDATLTWVGFSESQMLCTMDSEGTVRGLVVFRNNGQAATAMWTPLVDLRKLRKSPRDCHYMVGVTDKHVLAVLCKVHSVFAGVYPDGMLNSRFVLLFYLYPFSLLQPPSGRCHLSFSYTKASPKLDRLRYANTAPARRAWWGPRQR